MLLGIFSDTHLGFGSDERKEEAFARFDESIQIFKEKKVDYILHAGDLFDHSVPEQEVWHKTMECFNKNNSKLTTLTKKEISGETEIEVKGIPIIAIHGTHEHRGKDFSNALDVLEEANCLAHLHAGFIELTKDSEKVCIHGLGGVPEKMALQVLQKYNPKPISNTTNILLLHQSFKEFLPFDDDAIATLSLADLPEDFDLIIDGHLHWTNEQNIGGKRFLLTGSSIFTQMKKLEGEKEKGIFTFDTNTKKLDFIPFAEQRKLFYSKMKFDEAKPEEIILKVSETINSFLTQEFKLKPLIRIKLVGTIAKGFSQKDIRLSIPEDKAIFSISKSFEMSGFKKQINDLKELQKEKKSVIELGINILEKNVEEAKIKDFDTRRIFDLLSEGETEKAEKILLKKN
jgi:DNA repair exonuclease SbcCD nuclease subunit